MSTSKLVGCIMLALVYMFLLGLCEGLLDRLEAGERPTETIVGIKWLEQPELNGWTLCHIGFGTLTYVGVDLLSTHVVERWFLSDDWHVPKWSRLLIAFGVGAGLEVYTDGLNNKYRISTYSQDEGADLADIVAHGIGCMLGMVTMDVLKTKRVWVWVDGHGWVRAEVRF